MLTGFSVQLNEGIAVKRYHTDFNGSTLSAALMVGHDEVTSQKACFFSEPFYLWQKAASVRVASGQMTCSDNLHDILRLFCLLQFAQNTAVPCCPVGIAVAVELK